MDDQYIHGRDAQPCAPTEETAVPVEVASRIPKHRNLLASALGILLLSVLAVGVTRLISNDAPVSTKSDRRLPVKTAPLQAVQSYTATRTYTGEVVAQRASELGFERAGELVKVYVDRGDRVKSGTPIAKLDTRNLETQRSQLLAQKAKAEAVLEELQNRARAEDIAAARSQVRDLEQQLSLEKIKRDRREQLWRDGAISREQFDEIAYGSNALSERLAAARSNLDELLTGTRREQITAQQAEVRQLQASIADIDVTIAKSTIKAPFSGIVATRQLDEGTVVNAGQAVVRLVEDIKPEVEIGVPTQVIEQLRLGSQQQVQIGQKTYPAKITSILPEINSTTRTRTVILTLPSAISNLLAPRQVARLQVQQNVATTGYWLPTTALVRGERGLWAFYTLVETKDTSYQVERRDVEVLHTAGERTLVRGTIQSGDKAIIDGTQRIVPGQLVEPI